MIEERALQGLQIISQQLQDLHINNISYQYFHNLLERRTILFNQDIAEDIVENIIMPLREFEEDKSFAPVKLIIHTAGGSPLDGLVLCDIIDNYKKPLEIIVLGHAFSTGTILLCAGNNNPNITKFCYSFSYGLIHAGSIALSGESNVVKDTQKFFEDLDERVKKYIISNTKITQEQYDASERKQWFISSAELKELGLIDKIIGIDT